DWTSIGTMVVTSVIGWGLVVNNFAEDAAWNNWQGYLLFLIGGRDGEWAYANLGVFFALVLSFLVTYFARAAKMVCGSITTSQVSVVAASLKRPPAAGPYQRSQSTPRGAVAHARRTPLRSERPSGPCGRLHWTSGRAARWCISAHHDPSLRDSR
ncbi:hypothetical protein, partial [Enterococcus faecium]|uniref:hypothetical protein n=1 Tax=Enterococcus faecium TaxID=1352 RepID=UPI0030C84DED